MILACTYTYLAIFSAKKTQRMDFKVIHFYALTFNFLLELVWDSYNFSRAFFGQGKETGVE